MISWKKLRWLAAVILIAGCGGNQSESILDKPPFAGVTDSIRKFPDNNDLLLRRAILLSQHDLHDLAYEDYSKAWLRDSSEMLAMHFVSNLFLVDRADEAVRVLESSTRRFPDNPEFRRRLSEAYMQSGRTREAIAQYDNIIQSDSSNFEAWYEKGLLLTEMEDTAAAIDALARSYALQPLNMNGIALANLYAETRNPLAITVADALIAKDSLGANLDPIFIKGIYYSNTKQYPQAMEQFDKCIKIDWKFTDAYLEKGIALFEQQNIDMALETFKMATTVSATNADAYFWQGRCYEAIGKKEEALDNYIRAYSLDRNFVEAKEAMDRMRK